MERADLSFDPQKRTQDLLFPGWFSEWLFPEAICPRPMRGTYEGSGKRRGFSFSANGFAQPLPHDLGTTSVPPP